MRKLIYPKVATDMFWAQLSWAFGYLGVLAMIHIVRIVTSFMNDTEPSNYYVTIFVSSNIFMLVIGIISAYGFLEYFVGNGVTRRDFFKGSSIAAVGLSIVIPIVASVVTVIETVIFKALNLSFKEETLAVDKITESGDGFVGEIIGNVVQVVILAPFVELYENWPLAITVLVLNLFFYYLVGWFISAAFQRFGVVIGLGCIVFSIMLVFVQDIFLRNFLDLNAGGLFADVHIPFAVAGIGVFLLLAILLMFIRQFTKRVPIKL